MERTAAFAIDSGAVHDIPSLYDELNRVFMGGESWQLGPSLDALDDLLYGGFGALNGVDHPRVVWHDHEAGRGQTYFEIVREVFAGHPAVDLVLEWVRWE